MKLNLYKNESVTKRLRTIPSEIKVNFIFTVYLTNPQKYSENAI